MEYLCVKEEWWSILFGRIKPHAATMLVQIHGYIDTDYVLNVFIDIQTSKELIQMDTDKMMTYGTFTMDDEKLTQS